MHKVFIPVILGIALGISLPNSCKDVCVKCKQDPTIPGCDKVLASGQCNSPTPSPNPTPSPTPIPVPTPTPIPNPTPSPIPNSCIKLPNPTSCLENKPGQFQETVNKALKEVTGCDINSTCHIDDWKIAIISLMENLNAKGFCTSFDIQGGNSGLGSELGVRRDAAFTEFYQPITANQTARWASPRSVCNPAFDEEILSEVKAAWQIEIPPTASKCPVRVDANYFVDLIIGKIGGNPQQYSATAKYCGFPVRKDKFSFCGTKCCTLGVDGVDHDHPDDPRNANAIPCEIELSGVPSWFGSDTLQIIPAFDGNPYNVKITGGHGILKACGKGGCSNEITF